MTEKMLKKGVLLMAYGSPNNLDEIEPYYTDIRRGNKPTPELLHELTERYKMIGGSSPLLRVTNQQAASLQRELGNDYKVYVGMRHWTPWIHEAFEEMYNDGIDQAVGIVMAPHFSSMSIAKYIEKVEKAKEQFNSNIPFKYIESWHTHPLFISALEEKIQEAQKLFSADELKELTYIFTAHSLPEKILLNNDPYKDQLLETCRLVADKMSITNWTFAFQSAGRTQEKWLGPDLLDVIQELTDEGKKSLLVCSVGFITDHLEVMFDIDIEGKQKAKEVGVHLERAGSLNDHPNLGKLFKELVLEKFGEFNPA